MDPIFESTRRTSSGSIISTDVIDSIGSPAIGLTEPDFSETSDRFYLLKKDSQRRAFVVRVLKLDKSLIIDSWHRVISKPDALTKVRTRLELVETCPDLFKLVQTCPEL